MSGPVIAATATRIAAFSPLLFWPGIVGEFMKYLPITLIATLSASLAVALFFTPTLGALLGKAAAVPHDERAQQARRPLHAHGARSPSAIPARRWRSRRSCLVAVQLDLRQARAAGSSSFPIVEPDYGLAIVHGRGNLSLDEKNRVVAAVEQRVLTLRGPQDRLFARRRAAARLERHHRGHHRGHPVRVRGLARPAAGARDHGCDPGQDRGHSGRAGRGDGAARRPAHRQADPDTDRRHRSRRAAERGQEGRRHPGAAHRHPRPRRWPAAARHRLEDRASTRRRRPSSAPARARSAPPSSSSPTGSRSPNSAPPTATRRSTSWCGSRPTGAASTRSTNCGCRRRRATCRSEISSSRVPAPRVGYINRVAGYRVMTVSANVPEGAQTAKIQAGHRAGAGQSRSRARRGVAAQGRGRGARQGLRLPAQGLRHRAVPDLRDPAGAVQQVRLGRLWC